MIHDRRYDVLLWVGYALVYLMSLFVYGLFLPYFPLWGATPVLLPVAVGMVAVLEGSFTASVFGLSAGAFTYLTQPGAGPGLLVLGAALGMLAGAPLRRRVGKPLGACLVSALGCCTVYELWQLALRTLSHQGSLAAVGRIALGELVYSMLPALLVYVLFSFVHRSLGTE